MLSPKGRPVIPVFFCGSWTQQMFSVPVYLKHLSKQNGQFSMTKVICSNFFLFAKVLVIE